MRLGCFGCLGILLGSAVLLVLIGGGAWAWSRAWTPPRPPLAASHARPDASAVDRKLAVLWRGPAGRPTRADSITLSEAEVSALAFRFLEDAGLLPSSLTTEMREGRAMVQWRGPVGALLQGPPFGWLTTLLTRPMTQAPLWITVAGGVQLGSPSKPGRPRYAEVRLTSAQIGRLSVPAWLLALMAGPRGASLLRWPVRGTIDRLELGEGRLTIRTR